MFKVYYSSWMTSRVRLGAYDTLQEAVNAMDVEMARWQVHPMDVEFFITDKNGRRKITKSWD